MTVIASFDKVDDLMGAARRLRPLVTSLDAYTPHPVEALDELLDLPSSPLPPIMLIAGLLGAVGGFLLQLLAASAYPVNVGGRPIDSWPAFIPSTFELGILTALLVGFAAYLFATRLTALYHPIFSAPGFERAAQDRYLLAVGGRSCEEVAALLAPLRPRRLVELPG
jgi:ActD protein